MSENFVVDGALTFCDGSASYAPRVFKVSEETKRRLETNEGLQGIATDAKSENIVGSYGYCKLIHSICKKNFLPKWFNVADSVRYTTFMKSVAEVIDVGYSLIPFEKLEFKFNTEAEGLVKEDSVLVCANGGVIYVVEEEDGQKIAGLSLEIIKQIEILLNEYYYSDNIQRKKEIISQLKKIDPPHPVSYWQLQALGWFCSYDSVERLNTAMKKAHYDENVDSMRMFIAHMSAESMSGLADREPLIRYETYYLKMGENNPFKDYADFVKYRGADYAQGTTKAKYVEIYETMRDVQGIDDPKILTEGCDYVSDHYQFVSSVCIWKPAHEVALKGEKFNRVIFEMSDPVNKKWPGNNFKDKMEFYQKMIDEDFF